MAADILNDDEFEVDGPNDNDLRTVSRLAQLQLQYHREVEVLEQELQDAKERLRQIQEIDLPEAMLSCQTTSYTTDKGISVQVAVEYYAHNTKESFPAAQRWLKSRGYEDIITNSLELKLGKGEEALTKKIIDLIRRLPEGNRIRIDDKSFINAQTLKAFVREQIRNNVPIPFETFGVYVRRIAKVVWQPK